jgi:hypothetical protein
MLKSVGRMIRMTTGMIVTQRDLVTLAAVMESPEGVFTETLPEPRAR